ncbi:MAG: cobyrinate a,c-diamide synthase [Eubacteriales bacterium]|nr:cobyrinate a,c-diamide synthase [Eubacteriales bacterium]
MKYRLMLTGTGSGCGKTTLTCGLLEALRRRGLSVQAYKCGPDYIDPLFHAQVLGRAGENLDGFFSDENELRRILAESEADFGLIEGAMGYYDGLGATTDIASAYDVSRQTQTAAVLVVPAKGMSLSVCALISGYLRFRADSQLRGVILNRVSAMFYPTMKRMIEDELGIAVLGYIPALDDLQWGSRHLGLLLPEEIEDLRGQIDRLADVLETTLDIDRLITVAAVPEEKGRPAQNEKEKAVIKESAKGRVGELKDGQPPLRIAVADDEAFCFHYRQNRRVLIQNGAELIRFSPLHDRALPAGIDGLILPGGYPELHAVALSENQMMLESIRSRLRSGLPTLAECGGYMYLHKQLEAADGRLYPMVGFFEAAVHRQSRLQHFGYAGIDNEPTGGWQLQGSRVHEFHYYSSDAGHQAVQLSKPLTGKSWTGMYADEQVLAGFPHFFYSTDIDGRPTAVAAALLEKARAFREHRLREGCLCEDRVQE